MGTLRIARPGVARTLRDPASDSSITGRAPDRGPWPSGSPLAARSIGDSEAEADGHVADINLLGVFVERRYVSSERVARYVSARLAPTRFDVQVEVLTSTADGHSMEAAGFWFG